MTVSSAPRWQRTQVGFDFLNPDRPVAPLWTIDTDVAGLQVSGQRAMRVPEKVQAAVMTPRPHPQAVVQKHDTPFLNGDLRVRLRRRPPRPTTGLLES